MNRLPSDCAHSRKFLNANSIIEIVEIVWRRNKLQSWILWNRPDWQHRAARKGCCAAVSAIVKTLDDSQFACVVLETAVWGAKRRVAGDLLNSNRPAPIVALLVCCVHNQQKRLVRFVRLNVQVDVLAAHVAAKAGSWQAGSVEINRSRDNKRVRFRAASSVDWRRKREFVKVQLELANWPLVVELISLQGENTNWRIKSLLVH